MVVLDATMLMLLIRPDAGRPTDPATGEPVENVPERIAHFVAEADRARTRIGIPTPALSEVLVRSGSSAMRMLAKIKEFSVFEILPFDELSAIEVAFLTRSAIEQGDKRSGSSDVWSKIKYDRQIAAIAKVRQATALYTDDMNLRNIAGQLNIPVIGIAALLLPPETAQGTLPLGAGSEQSGEPTLTEIERARDAEAASPDLT